MHETVPPIPFPLTVRELKALVASSSGFFPLEHIVRPYLPMVHGCAAHLLAERPELVEEVCVAVFRTFLSRWEKLPSKTVIGSWLLRSVWFAAVRQRKALRLPSLPQRRSDNYILAFLKGVLELSDQRRDVLVLGHVLSVARMQSCGALRVKESRFKKEESKGLMRLAKVLRKRKTTISAESALQSLAVPALPEMEAAVRSKLQNWKIEKKGLAQEIVSSWQWFAFRRVMRDVARVTAVLIWVLLAFVMTMIWLSNKGFFTAWSIQNSGHQLVKQFPGLGAPAKPWPVSAGDRQLIETKIPKSASELYGLSNIWVSKFSFTAEDWKHIEPTRVEPVPDMMKNGKIVLRNPKAKRNGLAGVVGIDFNWTEGRMEFAGQPFEKVAVRYRGNGTYLNSLFGPKQSFKVDLNKHVPQQSLAGIHSMNFVNAIPDNSYVHDTLAQELFRGLGVVSPRTSYSYLTLDVPGKFTNQALGLYVLIENIDGDFAASRLGSKKAPIFKPVTYHLFQDLGTNWSAYERTYDLKTKATPEQLERVMEFSKFVTSATDEEFARRLPEFLDMEEYAGFLAGHVVLSSYDGYLVNGQNYYMYLDPKSNRFGFISWDQDHAWGEFGYVATAEKREHASIWHPATYDNRFLERVMKVGEFKQMYRAKLEWALANYFSVERLYPKVDELAARLRPAVAAESEFRLGRFDTAVSTNWLTGSRNGAPEGPKAPVHQIKRFIVNRAKSLREQLDGKVKETWPGKE